MKKVATTVSILLTSLALFSVSHKAMAQVFSPAITNSGFEQEWTSDPKTAMSWSPYQGGFVRTNFPTHSGIWSIQVTNTDQASFSGAFQRIDLNQTSLKPVFIGGYVKGSNISPAPGSYFGASLYAEIHLQSGRVAYWNTAMNTGTFDWRWIGFNTGSLLSVNEPISYIYVIPVLGQASGTAWFDDITSQEITPQQAALTIMFDDGSDTDFTIARPVLAQYGLVGSLAIITGNIGAEDSMTINQIDLLFRNRYDIISHTVTHDNLTTLSPDQVESELRDSQARLTFKGYQGRSLALPFGAYNGNVLAQAQKYYTSVRAFEIGYNPQGLFPYDVKVLPVVDTTPLNTVRRWIASAQQNNTWAVMVFHRLSDTGDDIYHTSPAMFEKMMQVVAESGIKTVTYDQGIQLFQVPH